MLPVRARRGFSRNKEASITYCELLLKKYLPLPLPLKVYYSAGRYYVDGCRPEGGKLIAARKSHSKSIASSVGVPMSKSENTWCCKLCLSCDFQVK